MTIVIILAVAASIFFLWICLKRPATTYSFQVYDNKNQYIYTKRITAKTEVEAETKIKNYIPHDYTYKLIEHEN